MATLPENDPQALHDILGGRLAKAMYVNTTCSIAFAGVQCFICLYIVLSYLESSKAERRGRLPYVIASTLIFVLFTLMASLDSFYVFTLAFESTNGRQFDEMFGTNYLSWARSTSVWAMTFFVTIADSVLVYRSYMIWQDKWWVCIPSIIALLLATAFSIASHLLPYRHLAVDTMNTGWTACSAAVNIFSTGIIAFRLIRANISLQRAMPNRKGKVFSDVVTMVVESALPPAIFGIIFAAISFGTKVGYTVGSATSFYFQYFTFSLLFYGFVALSPQLIIFRVTTGRSWARVGLSSTTGSSTAEDPSNPLHFAHSTHIDTIFLTQDEHRHDDSTGTGSSSDRPGSVKEKNGVQLQA